MEVGPGGVPKDAKTSEYYRVKDIPNRFDHPGKIYNHAWFMKESICMNNSFFKILALILKWNECVIFLKA